MTYASVCSGIEAVTVAWHPLGMRPAWFSEIDPFCCELLKHYYPEVPNLGDLSQIRDPEPVDVLVGGTPCQAFSVAGKRGGLDDARGNLTLQFLDLAGRMRPRWIVWENVPGVLSIDGGRTFGAILEALAKHGYGFAYRVLDAQYFGVPQRRRRVFVVGHLGDWRRAAAVLLEPQGVRRDTAPRREAGQEVAGTLGGGSGSRGWCDDIGATFILILAFSAKDHGADAGQLAPTLRAIPHDASHANGGGQVAVCVQDSQSGVREHPTVGSLRADAPGSQPGGSLIRQRMAVRRLTPRECERLQGFPDDYTLIDRKGKPAADGPRYRVLGNSMAVPVMRWIGRRVLAVDAIEDIP